MVARYNPCGAVVDIGSSPYKTRARLYPDSDQEFEIEWYEARPDAPLLGVPSALNCLEWEGDRSDWLPTVVGEIFGANVTRSRRKIKPLATGQHRCGTAADFAGDGIFDPLAPPVEYREDGLPTCCAEGVVGEGGLGFGGEATVAYTGPYTGYGGLVLGGSAYASYSYPPEGGLVLGGSAYASYSYPPEGGLVLGGSAYASYGTPILGSGGLGIGGVASVSYGTPILGSGGLGIGGVASVSYGTPILGSGGLGIGGAASVSYGTPILGSGGLGIGGAASVSYGTPILGSGGMALSGQATVSYTPPGPGPGATCETAFLASLNETRAGTLPTGANQQWWMIGALVSGTTYYVATTGIGSVGGSITLFEGGTCSTKMPVPYTLLHANCYRFVKSGNGPIWLSFLGGMTPGGSFSFNVSTTPC